jgi:DNA-binding NarL/FixJ family response regulator
MSGIRRDYTVNRVATGAWSADPLAGEGIAAMLREAPDLYVVPMENMARAGVVAIVGNAVDGRASHMINRLHLETTARIVLVIDELTDGDLLYLSARSVAAILPRSSLTAEVLADAVRRVHTQHTTPRLVAQLERVQSNRLRPRGAPNRVLAAREQEVLRLLAQGLGTAEISERMAYSERTVKNIIQVTFERLGSRNRAHAVAIATREGMI